MNQPGIQNWLQEMKDESLSQYDIMTVGEANGVNPDNAEEWVGEDKGKFNMIFQFEHLGLWSTGDSQFDVKSYKEVLNRWQKRLEGIGWNALFIETMINLVVYQLGVTIKITGLNLLQATPLCISYSKVHRLSIKDKKLV